MKRIQRLWRERPAGTACCLLVLVLGLLLLAACDGGVTVEEDSAYGDFVAGASDPGPAYLYLINALPNETQGFAIDRATGALTAVPGASQATGVEGRNLVVDPTGKHLYGGESDVDSLFGFAVDPATGNLSALSGSPYAATDNLTDIAMHPSGNFVYVASSGGDYVELQIRDPDSGVLSFNAAYTTTGTRPVSLMVSPDGATLYVAVESANQIERFSINQGTGALTSQGTIGTSSEPVAIAIDATGSFLYVGHGLSAELRAYAIAGDGSLSPLSPAIYGTNDESLGLTIDASGNFLYVAVPGQDQVQAFLRNPATGALSPIGNYPTGTYAESLATCGSFLYAGANVGSDVTSYAIDPTTGALTTLDTVATTGDVMGMVSYNCN